MILFEGAAFSIDMLEQYMWVLWLCVFVISLVLEAATAEAVSIWFAAGAIVSLILSFIPGIPFWVEMLVFVASSVVFFFALRPLMQKYTRNKVTRTNADSLVGSKGIILTDVKQMHPGEIEVHGVTWTAILAEGEEPIEEGEVAVVTSISGNKLVVRHNKKAMETLSK
jgi:membrane protein implicated in regulation of membrane protease activity